MVSSLLNSTFSLCGCSRAAASWSTTGDCNPQNGVFGKDWLPPSISALRRFAFLLHGPNSSDPVVNAHRFHPLTSKRGTTVRAPVNRTKAIILLFRTKGSGVDFCPTVGKRHPTVGQ